ncbi:MAG TPA: hypothetical protein VL921_04790 [Candidatus Udaeobacter sp.]|jgi:thiosulfate dehydrogenase [quinone] large subunit|nr:hypothetical protein [Candidatus Udaeobacter sp.]
MLQNKKLAVIILPIIFIAMRVLFGFGWLLAGVTKITDKAWFSEPGVFLTDYLLHALNKENVPIFHKHFIENIALEHVMFFNYVIPIVQIAVGVVILIGLMTIPSIFICLYMHINFILSGNINLISLVLYTSAFTLLLGRKYIYHLSLDRYLGTERLFNLNRAKAMSPIQAD